VTKVHAKIKAIELRQKGHSYNYIASNVGVSKGTLAAWLANIPYTPTRIGKARAASGLAKNRLKLASLEQAKREAVIDIGTLSSRELFMLGLGLYIGEGAKSLIATCFVNSNPTIMKLIVRWFTEALDLPKKNIRIRLHIYPDTNEQTCIDFWSQTLDIPENQFLRSVVDRREGKKAIKAGKLPYGTAHLTVHSLGEKRFGVFLARKIAAWSDLVLSAS
jgi:hypothetical protein